MVEQIHTTYTDPRLTGGDEPYPTISRYSTPGRLFSDEKEITGGKKADHQKSQQETFSPQETNKGDAHCSTPPLLSLAPRARTPSASYAAALHIFHSIPKFQPHAKTNQRSCSLCRQSPEKPPNEDARTTVVPSARATPSRPTSRCLQSTVPTSREGVVGKTCSWLYAANLKKSTNIYITLFHWNQQLHHQAHRATSQTTRFAPSSNRHTHSRNEDLHTEFPCGPHATTMIIVSARTSTCRPGFVPNNLVFA